MVLDCCPEFYVGGKENLWPAQNDEHQRRCWLAPKADVGAADPVEKKMPKAVPALVATVAPAALSSRFVQTSAGRELSRTYATAHSIAGFRRVPIYPFPEPSSTEILTVKTSGLCSTSTRRGHRHKKKTRRGAKKEKDTFLAFWFLFIS